MLYPQSPNTCARPSTSRRKPLAAAALSLGLCGLGFAAAGAPSAGAQSTPSTTTVLGPTTTTTVSPSTTVPVTTPPAAAAVAANSSQIGDAVWLDLNGDGKPSPGDPGLGGVVLQLQLGGNVIAEVTTDSDGHYSFNNLGAGAYTVVIVRGLPDGLVPVGTSAGPGTTLTATVNGTDSNHAIDFAFRGTATLCSRVWIDSNNNGRRDTGDVGDSLEVVAMGPNSIALTTTSTDDGKFCLRNIPGGAWTLTTADGARSVTLTVAAEDVVEDVKGIRITRPASLAFTGGTVVSFLVIGVSLVIGGEILLRRRRDTQR